MAYHKDFSKEYLESLSIEILLCYCHPYDRNYYQSKIE